MPGFDGVTSLLPNTVVAPTISGPYTPTFTNIAGTSAFSAGVAWYARTGDIVFVCGSVTLTLTLSSLNEFYISTPVSSNFTTVAQAAGVINQVSRAFAGQILTVVGQANKVKAQLSVGSTAGSPSVSFVFGFPVL